jgi:hypothetical protein
MMDGVKGAMFIEEYNTWAGPLWQVDACLVDSPWIVLRGICRSE